MTLNSLFRQTGRLCQIRSVEGEWHTELYNAVIQPLRYKNKMYLEDKRLDLGVSDMGYYLYIGPPSHDLSELDPNNYIVRSDSHDYFITRAEKVYLGERVFYIWAVLRRKMEGTV